jgi:hypothetical protein
MTSKDKTTEKAVINIISDHILWSRMELAVFKIHNVFNPGKKDGYDWEADQNYYGYSTALLLMSIENDHELIDVLSTITFDMICQSDENSKDLAKNIYIEWLNEIANYYTSKNEVCHVE